MKNKAYKAMLATVDMASMSASAVASDGIVANETPDSKKIAEARHIIAGLQHDMDEYTEQGSGPFVAAIYDADGKLVVKMPNTVVLSGCSHNHAEMNVIRAAQEKLGVYDLTPFNLRLYSTAEPCVMCMGGIMWSGIKEVYYGVPSASVEKIAGFDEGYKPEWMEQFKKRGITVYGNIEPELGEQALRNYVAKGKKIYQPSRPRQFRKQ